MSRVFTEKEISEIQTAEAGLRDSGLDVDHEYANHNATIIMNYIEKNPRVPVTVQSIYAVVESQKTSFVWRTPAQRQFDKTARENPQAAQQVTDWLAQHGGRPGGLIHTGDQGFQNSWNILEEIRGREINDKTIREAIGRIEAPVSKFATRKRPSLHRVPTPRPVDPRQHQDDEPFLGRDLVKQPDGSYRSKTVAEQRREMEAAERAKSLPQTPALDASEQAWKSMADGLLNDGPHSQQARVQAVYDREQTKGSSWRRIYEACKCEANVYSKTTRGITGLEISQEFENAVRGAKP
jgi:hypothetical protein